jgi:hypothetical protein
MKFPNREEQRRLVRQWEETGRELERLRREKLRNMPYNWEDVDALLQLGDYYDGPPRLTSGLVEMQRYFMKRAPGRSDEQQDRS